MDLHVWAPRARRVDLVLGDADSGTRHPMAPVPHTPGPEGGPGSSPGWWCASVDDLAPGTRYGFSLDGGPARPDPRAAWLPDGVHSLGALYDHAAFEWTDRHWRGLPLESAVVYELHVGTFTPSGTFDGVIDRLDDLIELGVTHVELMPVAAWDGPNGWGYDGAALWAVHEPYGGPDGLKRLVDACHAKGLAVLLDVVHNHLGPSGNYLPEFGPYFTEKHSTPWGPAINLDDVGCQDVRDYLVDSALAWLRDFHVDGLRLDAVHELKDDSDKHLLAQLSAAVDRLEVETGRTLLLIAESDANDPTVVTPLADGGYGMDGQWSDDFHHALHALLTGEKYGFLDDFAADPYAALSATLTRGWFHVGTFSGFRGQAWGRAFDVEKVPGFRFVGFTQNHDQIGNRAAGDRLCHTLTPGRLAAASAVLLTSPFTPLLFQGEEWAASAPFPFFSSFPDPELGRAVTEGRRRDAEAQGWGGDASASPDPQAVSTFESARLDWSERSGGDHQRLLGWYRTLLALRRDTPDLRDPWLGEVSCFYDADAGWFVIGRGDHRVVLNLADGERTLALPCDPVVPPRLVAAWDDDVQVMDDGRVRLPGPGAAVVTVG
ncbi:MAG: malto-oligosyltrehalose trehalohydrolase [Kineosporiaceae bacterium]